MLRLPLWKRRWYGWSCRAAKDVGDSFDGECVQKTALWVKTGRKWAKRVESGGDSVEDGCESIEVYGMGTRNGVIGRNGLKMGETS